MKNLRNSKGFTLIELMIVVVIIGILAAIAIPKFSQVSKSAKEAEADPILKQGYSLQQSYYQRFDTYASDANLQALGWDPNANGKYYTFAITGPTQTDFVITATPITAGVVCSKSISNTRIVNRATC